MALPAKPTIKLKQTPQPRMMPPLVVGPGANTFRAPAGFGKQPAVNLGKLNQPVK